MTVGLSKTFPGGIHAVEPLDLTVARRRDLRPAGAQRRRQDHDRRHALDARGAHRRLGLRGRRRRGARTGPGQAGHRRRRPVQHAGPQPHGLGEPVLPLPLLRHDQGRSAGARRRAARAVPPGRPRQAPTSTRSSGGMAQRLMVARSIAHRPHILFLDEPTAGLDPQSRLALWEILRRAARRGPHRAPHHPLHGRGRPALRPGGDHGPRPHPRAGHAGRPQGVGGRRHDRARGHGRRPGRPGRAAWARRRRPHRDAATAR